MNVDELLLRAVRAGVTLSLDGDRLSYRATGGLPDDLRGQLVDHRDEIIGVLRRTDTVEPMVPTGSTGAESGMSSGQQRLWLVEQMVGPSTLHHVHARLRWHGGLDPAVMSAAAHALARRHAALRTVFRTSGAAPVAVVRSADEEPLVEIAIADRSGAAADELLRGQQHTPFDLASGPLTRIAVVTVADDEHLIAVTQHHLVTDCWSVGLLLAELVRSYGALTSGRPAAGPLSDVDSVDYPDFVRWEKARRAAPPYRNRLDWWRRHLAGVVPLNLPCDGAGTARERDHRGSTWHFRVPARLLHRLRALARQLDTTPYVVLLAAWAVLLYRHTGQDDIVIGTVTSGRDRPELAGTVGFLSNTVVLRCDLSDGPTVAGLIRRLRSLTAQAFAHEVPFADVVAATGTARDTGLNPLFQAAFVYENLPDPSVADPSEVPGLVSVVTEGRVDGSVDGTTKFDLSLVVGRDGDGLAGLVDYPRARFSPATIARLAEHYLVLLDGIGTAPDTPVGALPMTRAADRRRLLGWAGAPAATSPMSVVDQTGLAAGAGNWLVGTSCRPVGELLRTLRPARFLNGYGSTETTTFAVMHPVDGRLAYLLDSRYAPVPVGVVGELYLGGAEVAAMAGHAHGDFDVCALPDLQAERAGQLGAATDGFVMFNAWDVPADERGPVDLASGARPTEVIASRRSDIHMDVQGELVFWSWRVPGAVWVRINVNERLAGVDTATLLRRTERFAELAADDPAAAVARLARLAIAEEPDGTPEHPRRQPSSPHPIRGETDHATIRHDLGPRRTR
ncbi:condensation domain-containing protein [Micromonospora sp. Llam0]|uniref:condensation domain-containing protein n=1 Tax=Micromonospora sp. Llam0 TaxID=2485143 RepID=UPI0013158C53|nr:condensation domain-containing protein [Micromonospora sp. Llam0]